MAEKLAGSEPENPRRIGGVRGALAAMGMGAALVAPEALASDKNVDADSKTPVAEQVSEEFAARLRDCTLNANHAFLLELAEQVGDELTEAEMDALLADFPSGQSAAKTLKWTLGQSPEAKAWVVGQVKEHGKPFLADLVGELKEARLGGFHDCNSENNQIIMAALDARIAAATAVFAEQGYRVGETENGETMLFFKGVDDEDIPAAHFVPGENAGEWKLDFAPLEAYREDLELDTEAMEERMRYIWQQIQDGEAITAQEAAALEPEIETAAVDIKG